MQLPEMRVTDAYSLPMWGFSAEGFPDILNPLPLQYGFGPNRIVKGSSCLESPVTQVGGNHGEALKLVQ